MTATALIAHLEDSLARAERRESRLAPDGAPTMSVGGFLGLQGRHLLNNLGSRDGLRYLEVGVLHGASLISAAHGNRIHATGIDNFSQFDGDAAAVRLALSQFPGESAVQLLEADCWTVDPAALGPVDVFYYDGDHSAESTARSFTYFRPALAEAAILLIDDYSWEAVRHGVQEGLRRAGLRVEYERELTCSPGDGATWWNGLWAAVVSKPRTCYLVVGPENSGTKMLAGALVSAGCYGDATDAQRLDSLEFGGLPGQLVLRRSIPHGCEAVPDLQGLSAQLTAAGYRVRPLCLYRNTTFLTAGQLRRGYAGEPAVVQDRVGVALRSYLELCDHLGEPPLLVPYEAFVSRPEFREAYFATLDLPAPRGDYFNANEAYGALPAVPW